MKDPTVDGNGAVDVKKTVSEGANRTQPAQVSDHKRVFAKIRADITFLIISGGFAEN